MKRSYDEFLTATDSRIEGAKRIEKALKELGNGWEPASEFYRRAKIAHWQSRHFREQFAPHVVVLPRTPTSQGRIAWVGDTKLAEKMRQSLTK